ncbi:MAG TPA: GAF domain-containing sensor histidine kinase, partial [Nitrospira sp.]|nr:GAF domain-containing sensor histidine kinase [Nitrospira sp.]
MKHKLSAQNLFLAGMIAAAVLFDLIVRSLFPNHRWVNVPLHSTVEALGGLAAVLMGLVLLARKAEWEDERLQGVASGLLGMGILEGFHAVSSPDQGFVLLRSAASLLGGVAFSFVWHPPGMIGKRTRDLMPYLVIGGTVAFGILAVVFPHQLPRFSLHDGFGPMALAVNGLAAVLFLAGAAGFWLESGRTGRPEHRLLATLAILFGLAETMFLFSTPWQSEWWTWHFVRFAAYVLALTYVSRGYVRMVRDIRNALAETKRSGRRLTAEYAVTRVLAESATLKDAGQAILQALGESLDWELGMFWSMEEQKQRLRFVDLWHAPHVEAAEFVDDSRGRTFQRGEGLIGRVWATGKPIWIPDVVTDPNFRRAPMAARVCLHGAFAFPVRKGEKLYGVMEFFSRESREPDQDVLAMVADIGIKVGLFVDRKRTEEELRRTEARLLEEQRLAEVAKVLGDIGHDLKNMLMPIVTGAELLEEELSECFSKLPQPAVSAAQSSRDLTQELIDMIRQGARRIHDRVKEIADSVKGLTRPPRFAPCRMADIVSSVYATLRILADERNVALHVEGLETLPVIRADESRLFNALYNLVNNAIPEVPSGGSVTVKGDTDNARRNIVLSVVDTGKGMSPEVRDSLFTYQAISRKVGGTGLGTKIVKDVVDAHGGSITVESEQGVGTSFRITLPVEGPPSRSPSPSMHPADTGRMTSLAGAHV